MKTGRLLVTDWEIKDALDATKTVAVLGMSPNDTRDSHRVGVYLSKVGYKVTPVRPAQEEIAGLPAVASLDDLPPGSIDMVDVFRNSAQVEMHVDEAIRLGAKVFWMQLGIVNEAAAKRLLEAGIDVVMDRCTKVEYARLCK